MQKVKHKKSLLEIYDLDYETVRKLISRFDEIELNLANNDIPQIAKENKIINKIKVLY